MLERRWFPTSGVFKSAKLVFAGFSTVDWTAGDLGNDGARARVPVPTELALEANTRSPRQTVRGVGAEGDSTPSPIHRAARIFRGHPAIGYIVAFASVGLATAFQWLARDLYDGTPFLLIYPAVVVTTFVGGYRAGLLSALLAGLSQWYLFIPAYNWLGVLSYAIDATLCVLLIEYINRTLEKETEAKQHQTLLKNELHHRINNLFAVIQSVIRFSLPNNDAPVSPALFKDRLLVRLQAMLDANQYVGDSEGEVALLDLVRGSDLWPRQSSQNSRPTTLDAQSAVDPNFSLILYELVTNSFKYGALSTARGRVHIELLESQAGVVFNWTELHGPMVSAPPDDGSGDGFGSRILGPFARGFCSDVRIAYDPRGFRYGLRIPLQGRPKVARSAATEDIRAEVI